ncbi:Pre-mRNA cleavage complex II protein Clp1-domain-containing protein [Tirmania nivea]|nr:Pre-mRNA cleavage complex II protein Clp1-domain-containing protein [Tirmania nivea]
MSVPGLQLTELNQSESITTHELPKGCEWRFEVGFNEPVEVKILSGTAEIFGTELPLGHKYTFAGTKLSIYTHHGCELECRGSPSVEYTAEETPIPTYTNLHFALSKLRLQASEQNANSAPHTPPTVGPRVMIIGPLDAGKTSLIKFLTGYAIREGGKPCIVNLDPREGVLSLPGTLTATTFSTIMDVEEGFGTSPTSGPSLVPVKLPLVYYYGFESPEANPRLYKKLVSRMALAVMSRLGEDNDAQSSGLLIDTPLQFSTPQNYDLIQHAVADFGVTTLVVVGSERLYSDMLRRYDTPTSGISVVKIPKSGGCVDRDETFLKLSRARQVKEYFFGEPKRTLSPYTMTVEFSVLRIFRLNDLSSMSNTSLLPGGLDGVDLTTSLPLLERVNPPTAMLTHCVLALLHCDVDDPVDVMAEASVMGFVYVVDVEEQKHRMKILAPVAGRLPSKPLVVGMWPEATGSLVG